MVKAGWRAGTFLFTALAVACSGSGQTPAPEGEDPADQGSHTIDVVGIVAVVGNTPFERVVIRPEDSSAQGVEVRGEYKEELRAVSGAKVHASGPVSGDSVMNVASYEILEIAGHRPVVGILEVEHDRVAVRSRDGNIRTFINGVPEQLRRQAGAKVWVILDEGRGVQAYGIIRKP